MSLLITILFSGDPEFAESAKTFPNDTPSFTIFAQCSRRVDQTTPSTCRAARAVVLTREQNWLARSVVIIQGLNLLLLLGYAASRKASPVPFASLASAQTTRSRPSIVSIRPDTV
jgi:hypothetical protein